MSIVEIEITRNSAAYDNTARYHINRHIQHSGGYAFHAHPARDLC